MAQSMVIYAVLESKFVAWCRILRGPYGPCSWNAAPGDSISNFPERGLYGLRRKCTWALHKENST